MNQFILALDQGTTSSRAILFDALGQARTKAQYPFPQIYPQPGWVEHDPMAILESQFLALSQCYEKSGCSPTDIAALAITNQRETALVWERDTGRPIHNAIVWQCRRTAAACEALSGHAEVIREKTGLPVDAYFSGTKFAWILDHVPGARERAERGELLCGTVDSWLIWNLTGGKYHVTDHSNAARTMLFNIRTLDWDEELCRLLRVPRAMLPRPVACSGDFGTVAHGLKGLEDLAGLPIRGCAGDQQAALFGQGCFSPGQAKNTYGTGCFTLMNVGDTPVASRHGLITTVGWTVAGKTTYVLEGSVFNAGSSIQWLRDELGLISSSRECDLLAESVPDNGGAYFVSAFTGLGAPHWDMYARGSLVGLTRGTGKAHICRAVLEGIAYQVADLVEAMRADAPRPLEDLRVDGGASVSDFMMQYQADLLGVPVDRPELVESTAFGTAALAGLSVGLWKDETALEALRRRDKTFLPQTDRSVEFALWHRAVERAGGWVRPEETEP